MQAVHTFSRTDDETLEQLLQVCGSGRGTAREQWSLQAEMLVEPLAWDALWKLSKRFCKKFDVRFPCVACVTVTSVNFENLSASVEVFSVQHVSVSLPEQVDDVALIELWPTLKQKEKCVNAETTAEFIDLLRFYYNNIWMPWDDQDDRIMLPKTVEERMKLWCDLHNSAIIKHVAREITLLRMSAIDAHEKLKELDSSLYEGNIADDDDDDDSLLSANYISLCAELTARLDCTMAKWTLYENSLIREHYINRETNKWLKNKKADDMVVALWQGGSVLELDEICKFLKGQDTDEKEVKVMTNAEEAFALEPKQVVICSKEFEIPEIPLANISICSFIGGGIKASSTRSWLLCASERCTLRGLLLHCAAVVNTLVVARAGELRLSRCSLTDDSSSDQSDFTQGIVAMPGAKVILEDCTLNNFYSGIVVHRGAQVDVRSCVISKCGVGIQLYGGAQVKLDNTTVTGCTENSIRCEMDNTHFDNDRVQELQIMPNCKVDSGYMNKKVLVVHQEATLL